MNWFEFVSVFMIVVALLASFTMFALSFDNYRAVRFQGEVLNPSFDVAIPFGANGYAYGSNYYVVRTDVAWFRSIEKTDLHESCHVLVYDDFEHFCFGGVVS